MKDVCFNSIKCLFVLISFVFLANCSSMVNEKQQKIQIAANVPNAKVYIDGEEKGRVPANIALDRRRKDYQLTIVAPGYEPYHAELKSKLCPFFYGNILLGGGPIGMIADACTGRCWEYDDDVSVALHSKGRDSENLNLYHQHFSKSGSRDMIVVSAPKKQKKVTSSSETSWSNVAGAVAGAVATAAINTYLNPGGTGAGGYTPDTSSNSSAGRKARVHVPKKTCSYCGGSGRVSERGTDYGYGASHYMKSCPSCRGKGYQTGIAELY